ncbi:MAG: hypothetical protein ACI8P5_001741, partial [Bacteroidia bacterium]
MSSRSIKLSFLATIICMVVSAFQLHAGVIDKAFEALEMKDYFKARELFQKVVRRDRLAGNYGLCLVHITKQNPFYDLDTAKIFALRTESFWKLASDREQGKMSEYGITAKSVEGLRLMVYSYAMAQVTEQRTVDACRSFVNRFSSSPQKK